MTHNCTAQITKAMFLKDVAESEFLRNQKPHLGLNQLFNSRKTLKSIRMLLSRSRQCA